MGGMDERWICLLNVRVNKTKYYITEGVTDEIYAYRTYEHYTAYTSYIAC